MTAVEWLIQQLVDRQNGRAYGSNLDEIYQQALIMEKQQIIDANIAGLIYPYVPGKPFGLEIAEQSKAEKYYEEKFKTKII